MHAGEPDLLDRLARGWRRLPDGRSKRRALLVDRQRLKGKINPRTEIGVVKLEFATAKAAVRNPERPNRIPNTDAPDANLIARYAIGEFLEECAFQFVAPNSGQAVIVPDLVEIAHVAFAQPPHIADQPRDATGCTFATCELQQEDVITHP